MRNRNQSKKKESEEPPKPAEEVKPLVPSANRWVPRSRVKKEEVKLAPDGSVMLESDEIERKVNSALNKLTLEMFEPITEDLLKIARQSIWEEDAKTVKQVISLTFAKACDEPYWSSVYAQFFAKMLKEVPDELKDVNTLTKNGEPAQVVTWPEESCWLPVRLNTRRVGLTSSQLTRMAHLWSQR